MEWNSELEGEKKRHSESTPWSWSKSPTELCRGSARGQSICHCHPESQTQHHTSRRYTGSWSRGSEGGTREKRRRTRQERISGSRAENERGAGGRSQTQSARRSMRVLVMRPWLLLPLPLPGPPATAKRTAPTNRTRRPPTARRKEKAFMGVRWCGCWCWCWRLEWSTSRVSCDPVSTSCRCQDRSTRTIPVSLSSFHSDQIVCRRGTAQQNFPFPLDKCRPN